MTCEAFLASDGATPRTKPSRAPTVLKPPMAAGTLIGSCVNFVGGFDKSVALPLWIPAFAGMTARLIWHLRAAYRLGRVYTNRCEGGMVDVWNSHKLNTNS